RRTCECLSGGGYGRAGQRIPPRPPLWDDPVVTMTPRCRPVATTRSPRGRCEDRWRVITPALSGGRRQGLEHGLAVLGELLQIGRRTGECLSGGGCGRAGQRIPPRPPLWDDPVVTMTPRCRPVATTRSPRGRCEDRWRVITPGLSGGRRQGLEHGLPVLGELLRAYTADLSEGLHRIRSCLHSPHQRGIGEHHVRRDLLLLRHRGAPLPQHLEDLPLSGLEALGRARPGPSVGSARALRLGRSPI